MQGQLDSVAKELKEEKLESKRLKSELVRTQDELAEVKMEKESAEMVIIIHPPLSLYYTHTDLTLFFLLLLTFFLAIILEIIWNQKESVGKEAEMGGRNGRAEDQPRVRAQRD